MNAANNMAGMFVSAVMAAKRPPDAGNPHTVITHSRHPISLAELSATPEAPKPQMATPYANADTNGDTIGVMMVFVGSMEAQYTIPTNTLETHSFKNAAPNV